MSTELRFTVGDLDLLPQNSNRYEIIDGELYVTTQPHWRHQMTSQNVAYELQRWSNESGLGAVIPAPGIIFADDEAVAPDIIWVQRDRFSRVAGDDGKLHAAPDLAIEILSPGKENERRDRDVKLKLYSRQGVREYWIVDWVASSVQIFRRQQAALQLAATLYAEDALTSPLLPGFIVQVDTICAAPR